MTRQLMNVEANDTALILTLLLYTCSYMNAEKYKLDRIYFGGYFIRAHMSTISTLSYAIRFWSKGTKRALFLRHEGYLGAVGAWIAKADQSHEQTLPTPGVGVDDLAPSAAQLSLSLDA